jgi:hypothetical protein
MKLHSLLAAAALLGSAAMASNAHAIIRDSLTPDGSVVQSALTAPSTSGEVDDFTGSPQIWSWANKSFGNSRFGASYSTQGVTAAWSAGKSLSQNFMRASVTAFGDTKDVLVLNIFGETDGNTQLAHVRAITMALGNTVRDVDRGGGDFNSTTNLTTFSQQLYNSGTQTFYIGPIPVSVGASINLGEAQSVKGHVWVDGIDASLRHSFALTATAFGGIGPWWANAGIKVKNLSLLSGSLALTSQGRYQFFCGGGGGCGAQYTIGHDYGLTFRELDGRVVLYASAFGFSDEYEIANWTGFTQTIPIFQVAPFSRSLGGLFNVPPAPQL